MVINQDKLNNSYVLADKLLQKVSLYTVKKVESQLQGNFSSIFYGHGLDFKEIREYTAQDDIRNIDWNVTARLNKPHVRVYSEEREHTVWLIIDTSSSMDFASCLIQKKDIAAQFVAVISYLAHKNGDSIGAIFLNNDVELVIKPSKGLKHVNRIVQQMIEFKSKNEPKSGLNLEKIKNIISRKNSVFFISDFIFSDFSWEKPFGELGMKNNLVAVQVLDPVEEAIPEVGYISLCNPETGEKILIDTSNKKLVNEYKRLVHEENVIREKIFASAKVDMIKLYTNSNLADILINYSNYKSLRRCR